jgi:hypothetical protein
MQQLTQSNTAQQHRHFDTYHLQLPSARLASTRSNTSDRLNN